MTWDQISETEWIGRASWLDYPVCITYVPEYGHYVSDGTDMPYKTLRAAKIAVARKTH